MSNRYFLYHGGCEDGFASALVPWQIFGDNATYVPVYHGSPPPNLPKNASVVMTDFSYKRDVLLEFNKGVKDLLVLDHHLTAQDDLDGLDFVKFDMEKSGATLSWEHWHPNESAPDLFLYVEDRDLWRFVLPESREVNSAIASYPLDFKVWDNFKISDLSAQGIHILRSTSQQVSRLAERATIQNVGGHKVPTVNASSYVSELLSELNKRFPDSPFAASFYETGDGDKRWSLSSTGDFNVGALAASLGGGGHYHRSGFIDKAN